MDQTMAQEYAYPSLLLMESAGRGAAQGILELYRDIPAVLVCCGTGNNGGDGFVVARCLQLANKKVKMALVQGPEKLKGDAAIMFATARKLGIEAVVFGPDTKVELQEYLQAGTIVVDALLGTGVSGELQEPAAAFVKFLAGVRNDVVALDMPSGLNANTGHVASRPAKAAHTFTFQLPKICHYVTPAANYCGQIHVVDIGIYPKVVAFQGIRTHLIDDDHIRYWYRPRQHDTHKGSYGHVLLAGGSRGKAGAIALSTMAALEMGAGLCTAFIPGSVACAFHRTTLENMSVPYGTERTGTLNETAGELFGTYVEGKDALAIGPGLDATDDTFGFLKKALAHARLPMVLDADALNLLAEHPELWEHVHPNTVLTPHPGEMARLLNTETTEVQNYRLEAATELAQARNVVVVLKGAGSLVAAPDGELYLCSAGNPGMATGGAGDVLTGTIAGLMAQGYAAIQAATMGVYIHAKTGDLVAEAYGQEGVVANKLVRNLGRGLRNILREGTAEQRQLF